jgi:hypothetical protein
VAAVGVGRPVVTVRVVDVGWNGRLGQLVYEGFDGHAT